MEKAYLFFLAGVLVLSGCITQEYNTATGKEDLFFISTEKETALGKSIAESIEKNPEIGLDPDPLMTERIRKIGQRVASVCDRKEVDYHFRVVDKDEVNAFALPGGYVFIFRGIVDKVESDDELACVIAHEVSHIVARHSVKRLQGSLGYDILRILTITQASSATDARAIDAAFGHLLMSYSREDEALADKMALKYVEKAGYDRMAMISFLEKLKEYNKTRPIRPYSSYRTHPYIADRIRMVKKELLGEVDFSDYMNKPIEY